jgi:hypothetical protein
MTLVTLPSPMYWPGTTSANTAVPGLSTFATLDASGEYACWVFVAREDMVISHVGFRAGTVTNAPTVTVSIEDVATTGTGFPSGSDGFGSTAATSATITSNTYVLTALGASATISKGTAFAVKLTWGGVATSTVIIQNTNYIPHQASVLPYSVVNVGTPTRAAITGTAGWSTIALGSNSTTFYNILGAIPMSSATFSSYNNTNAAKKGLRFTIPFDCRAAGIRWYNSNSTGNYNVALYDDTTGTAVELGNSSTAFDGDINSATTTGHINAFFDNSVTLAAGTTYRIAIEPTSATNVLIATVTIPSTNYRSATPVGTTAHYTTFVTGGWVDTGTDTFPVMDLIMDQVDDGAGTGGVVGVIGG